jgi:hypothetical protein
MVRFYLYNDLGQDRLDERTDSCYDFCYYFTGPLCWLLGVMDEILDHRALSSRIQDSRTMPSFLSQQLTTLSCVNESF